MYDIVTLEPDDTVVMDAVNAIIAGKGAIPGPNGNYQFIAPNDKYRKGDGGRKSQVLVVVAHANPDSLSGCRSWAEFQESVGRDAVEWAQKTTVYLAACSTANEDGTKFLYGNIAREVKKAFPNATVWASSSNVGSKTQSGDWQKL